MKGWGCNNCGCELRQEVCPKSCPLCGKKEFYDFEVPKPTNEDIEIQKKFDDVIDMIDEYEKDCEPKTLKHSCEE